MGEVRELHRNRRSLPLWLTVEQTARLLGVSTTKIYECCREGRIPHVRIGNAIRIDRDGLFYQARELVRKEGS